MIPLIDNGVRYQWLEAGRRLHLQHGPIDLIVEACGGPESVALAYQQAYEVFQSLLTTLVEEIDVLRQPVEANSPQPHGPVALRMYRAALPCSVSDPLTPMIAVAGSVADHVLEAMLSGTDLERAYVNNGGDIALWLAAGQRFDIGVCENIDTPLIGANITLQSAHGVRGIATSGWRGRSHSLGIADAVTVLATSAADADTAATLIANAVDVPDSPRIHRQPASELSPESDLGNTPVTVAVDTLCSDDIAVALTSGRAKAEQLLSMRRILSVYISLAEHTVVCGSLKQTLRAGAMHA